MSKIEAIKTYLNDIKESNSSLSVSLLNGNSFPIKTNDLYYQIKDDAIQVFSKNSQPSVFIPFESILYIRASE